MSQEQQNKGQTNHGQKIANIVHNALQTGDLSGLKNIGPAVQNAVSDGLNSVNDAWPYTKQKNEKNLQENANIQPKTAQPPMPTFARPKAGAKGIFRMVLGIVGMVTFALCTVAFAIVAAVTPLQTVFVPLAAICFLVFNANIVLMASGANVRKLSKRAIKYYELFDSKPVYTLAELAGLTNRSIKQLIKDVKIMHAKGWIEDLRFDEAETCLMRGDETYKLYLETQKNAQILAAQKAKKHNLKQNPDTAPLEAFKDEGTCTIDKIRAANDSIPGHEISAKLACLEDNCARIFKYVEEHPNQLPNTRKFMDYYMPTTLKLVEKYKEYEEMSYQPANVIQAKKQIEDALDTIDVAFKNLLESFYQPDTLDVSTDIVVLQNMLEQEGLVGRQFDLK